MRTWKDALEEFEEACELGADAEHLDSLYNEALSLHEKQMLALSSLAATFCRADN